MSSSSFRRSTRPWAAVLVWALVVGLAAFAGVAIYGLRDALERDRLAPHATRAAEQLGLREARVESSRSVGPPFRTSHYRWTVLGRSLSTGQPARIAVTLELGSALWDFEAVR